MPKYQVYNYTERKEFTFSIDNPFSGAMGEAFEQFLHCYSPDLFAIAPAQKLKLTKLTERICRFCNRQHPDTTFKKQAHVLPQLIGNRYLVHDCECDNCNMLFGTYEDSFSKYLGMMRTVDVIRGQNGVPVFKSVDGQLNMRLTKVEDGANYIDILDYRAGQNSMDENSIKLTGVKQPYIPLHVMKSLYKIGYSLLSSTELQDYEPTLKIITGTGFDNKLKSIAELAKFTLPRNLQRPYVITYRKKPEHAGLHIPTKVVALSFGRYCYQFFMLNSNDSFMFKAGENCTFMQIPPYFNGDQSKLIAERIDLSSPEKRVGEEHSAILTFDKK